MRACWLKWVGRDWSISADYIWLNYSGANIVGVALVALNGVTLDHARPVGKRERLEFGVGTASAVNPVAPSTFDIPALTLPHTVLSREKQVRRACPSPDRSRHCARTQEARQHVWPIWSRNSAPA